MTTAFSHVHTEDMPDEPIPKGQDLSVVLKSTPGPSFEQAFIDPETNKPTFFYQWLAALEAEIPGFTDSSNVMDRLGTSVREIRTRLDSISKAAGDGFSHKEELNMMVQGIWADKVADKSHFGISEEDNLVIKNAMTLADRKIVGVHNTPEAVRVELYNNFASLAVVLHRELRIQYPLLGGDFHADLGMIEILDGFASGNTSAGDEVGWGKDHLGQKDRLDSSIRILTATWAARRYRTQLIEDAYKNSPTLAKDVAKRNEALVQSSDRLRIVGPNGLSNNNIPGRRTKYVSITGNSARTPGITFTTQSETGRVYRFRSGSCRTRRITRYRRSCIGP